MSRWLLLALALGIAGAALYGIASSSERHAEIDETSRQRLLDVLREDAEANP